MKRCFLPALSMFLFCNSFLLYCDRLESWNLDDKILSSGGWLEIEANLSKVSEIERVCQGSKNVRTNCNFQIDRSITQEKEESYLEDQNYPLIRGILLLGNEEDLIQEGAPEFSGFKVSNLKVPGGKEALQKLLEPIYLNQPLTEERLDTVKKKIIHYYRENGHPLVIVDVPFQDVTDGVVQLVLIESRLGEVICRGNRWFPCSLLKSYISIKPGEPIDSEILLGDVEFLNQNPFRFTDVIYTPGQQRDTTDLELVTKDRMPWRIYGGGDNTGMRLTGHARWFTGFDWANAWGLDHILSFQGTTSTDLRRFRAVTFHYTAPLPWRDTFVAYGGYSKVLPKVDVFHTYGHDFQLSLRYQIPIQRKYHSGIKDLTFGIDYKNSNNVIEFVGGEETEVFTKLVNITEFVTGFAYGKELGNHELTVNTLFYGSPGEIMSHQTPEDFESQRPKATNHFLYQRFTFAWKYQKARQFAVYTQARFQLSTQNLVPSEQFGLGGYDTVRGYNERVLSVDQGLCFNFELRAPSFSLFRIFGKNKIPDQLTLLTFFDYGVGGGVRHVKGERPSQYLISLGPGLRYAIGSNLSVRFDWGLRLHRLPGENNLGEGHVGVILNY